MAKSSGQYQIPFDKDGSQLHYQGHPRQETTWVDNHDFEDTLTFSDYSRGRSAAYFHLTRADGRGVTMFLKELTEAIPYMVNGILVGRFRFIKRGENYGCMLVEPNAEPLYTITERGKAMVKERK